MGPGQDHRKFGRLVLPGQNTSALSMQRVLASEKFSTHLHLTVRYTLYLQDDI